MRLTTPPERAKAKRDAHLNRKCEQYRITRAYHARLMELLRAMHDQRRQEAKP